MLIDQDSPEDETIEDDFEESDGRHKAHIAAMEEDLEALQELAEIDNGSVFNYADNNGWTPLHEAARSLNLAIVKFMIENGADVTVRNVEDSTALDLAIIYGGDNHPVAAFLRDLVDAADDRDQEL